MTLPDLYGILIIGIFLSVWLAALIGAARAARNIHRRLRLND